MFLPSTSDHTLRVAIYRSSSIGDVVLATACVDFLLKIRCNVQISWIGKNPSIDLIKNAYPQVKIVEIGADSSQTKPNDIAARLSDNHFVLDLQASIRSRLICQILKKKYGIEIYRYEKFQIYRSKLIAEARMFGRRRSLEGRLFAPKRLQYESMCEAVQDGLNHQLPAEVTDGVALDSIKPYLPTSHDTCARPWQRELQYGRWLAIAPGASYETKRAPISKFHHIIEEILSIQEKSATPGDQEKIGLLILGDENDRATGVKLLDDLAWDGPFLNLAGKISLWESTIALKASDFLLSNDSGLVHISEAVSTPVAVLFGATIENFGFAPHLPSSRAFSSTLGCRPCSKHGKSPCRFLDNKCYHDISAHTVGRYIWQCLAMEKNKSAEI